MLGSAPCTEQDFSALKRGESGKLITGQPLDLPFNACNNRHCIIFSERRPSSESPVKRWNESYSVPIT
jgi:hypothetical protein